MKRKQQVGECWVYVIFFVCVCVGASGSTTVFDNPGADRVRGSAPKFFWAVFAILSRFFYF
jgi:hypothetical protein